MSEHEITTEFNPGVFGLKPEFAAELSPIELKAVISAVAKAAAALRHPDVTGNQLVTDFAGVDVRSLTAQAGWLRNQAEADIEAMQQEWTPSYEERMRDAEFEHTQLALAAREDLLAKMRPRLLDALAGGALEHERPVGAFTGNIYVNKTTPNIVHRYALENGKIVAYSKLDAVEKELLKNSPEWVQRFAEENAERPQYFIETRHGFFAVEANGTYLQIEAENTDFPLKDDQTRLHVLATAFNKRKVNSDPVDVYQAYTVNGERRGEHKDARIIGLTDVAGHNFAADYILPGEEMDLKPSQKNLKVARRKAVAVSRSEQRIDDYANNSSLMAHRVAELAVELPDHFVTKFIEMDRLKKFSTAIWGIFLERNGAVFSDVILAAVPDEVMIAK